MELLRVQLPGTFQVTALDFSRAKEISLSKPACPIIAALFQPLNFAATLLSPGFKQNRSETS